MSNPFFLRKVNQAAGRHPTGGNYPGRGSNLKSQLVVIDKTYFNLFFSSRKSNMTIS